MLNEGPNFDSIRQENVYGVEFWSARDLMPLLGYGKNWQNFTTAIDKAKIACEEGGQIVDDQFNASIKLIEAGKGATRKIDDYLLSRFACYLIAMNGNPRKPEIAAAHCSSYLCYFALTNRNNAKYT